MTKERELLRRALEILEWADEFSGNESLENDIRAYLAAEPEAEPVLYIKEQELLYIQVLKQEGLAQEWKSNLGFVKEAGDVGLYLRPPKPAKPEANCYGDGNVYRGVRSKDSEVKTVYVKTAEPARKPMTEEEIAKGFYGRPWPESTAEAFTSGIRFAEKHHLIGGADE